VAREKTTKGGNSEYHKGTESARNTEDEKLPFHARDANDRRFSGDQTIDAGARWEGVGKGWLGEACSLESCSLLINYILLSLFFLKFLLIIEIFLGSLVPQTNKLPK